MIVKYKIEQHKQLTELENKDIYVLWKETKTEKGYACRGICKGSKEECKKYLEGLRK